MTPERLAEIRKWHVEHKTEHKTWTSDGIVERELLAEIDALTRDNEWRKQQMEQVWPRNEFGSLLTSGEYEALLVAARANGLAMLPDKQMPNREWTDLEWIRNQWYLADLHLEQQRDQLTADIAKLRKAVQKAIDDAVQFAVERKPFPTFWLANLRRVLAETAPKEKK